MWVLFVVTPGSVEGTAVNNFCFAVHSEGTKALLGFRVLGWRQNPRSKYSNKAMGSDCLHSLYSVDFLSPSLQVPRAVSCLASAGGLQCDSEDA